MSRALAAAHEQTARIARLNDLARSAMGGAAQGSGDPKDRWKGCGGVACTAVATVGFRSLPDADQSQVRELIETFDAFTEDNDPHGERDFGTIYQLVDGWRTTDRPRLRDDDRAAALDRRPANSRARSTKARATWRATCR